MQILTFKGSNAEFKKYLELVYWLAYLQEHQNLTIVIDD